MKISSLYGRTIFHSLAGLVSVVVLMVLSLVNEFHDANQHAQVEVENISRILDEHALAIVQKTDLLLRDVLGDVHPGDMRLARGANSPHARKLHMLLKSHIEAMPELSALHLTNAKGEHIHSSVDSLPHIDISDRYHFQHQRDDPNAGLVISPPLISRTTGKWTLILTRRINFEDGSFAGTITAVLEPEYFQKSYRSLDMGSHGAVSLYDKELHLAARYPPRENDIGKISNPYAKSFIDKGINHATYHAKSILDGVDRMYSFRQVGDLPLFVVAGLADDDYLGQWRRHVWEYGIGLVILSLVVAGFELRQRWAEKALLKGEETLRTIADYTYDWEYWEGPQHELLYMSPSCERITGYSPAEFVADPGLLYRIIHPDDQQVMEEHRVNIAYTNEAHIDFRIVRRDGEVCWISHGCHAVHGRNGLYLGRRSSNRDISDRKKTEEMLHVAAIAFDAQKGMSVIVTDPNSVILLVNSPFTKITGYTAEEAVGKKSNILKSGRHDANFYAAMWESIKHTGAWEGEIWNRRKNGEIYPEFLTIAAVKNQNGIITNYVATFSDITAIKMAEDEINNLSFFDPLTRLPNRRLLVDRLKQALASSVRSGREGALLFIDLDNFKTLNDTLGHYTGDLLLQQVARRLESCVREGDTVARLGGDDFVVMMEDLSGQAIEAAAQTETVGEKILAILNQPYQLATHEYHSSASIGVTLFNDHEDVDELMRQADITMYQAKKEGRNILRFFDPQMQETVNIRADLEGELHKAIDNRQFQLYYQIQVDHLQHPIGAEALIRWIHPERGFINPAEFIPMAEETELILPIGLWVLETACAQIKEWQQNVNTRDLVLAVNVSAKQFRQADFVATVQATMQRHSINPMLLKLELTESMLLEKIEDTIATMTTLKEIGVRFSLDDFGTGYSSLQYLKRLPLNQLKIDQSFVRDLATDSSDRAIVRTIVAMAHSLNLDVIAEGVETEEQRQLIQDCGCKLYQGYLFSKPVPIEQFEALLKQSGNTFS